MLLELEEATMDVANYVHEDVNSEDETHLKIFEESMEELRNMNSKVLRISVT